MSEPSKPSTAPESVFFFSAENHKPAVRGTSSPGKDATQSSPKTLETTPAGSTKVPQNPAPAPKNDPCGDYQAAGSALTAPALIPVSEYQAIDISSQKPVEKPTQNISKRLSIADFAAKSSRSISTYQAYKAPQVVETTPKLPELLRMSSVSTGVSSTTIDTTLDYSLFKFPPQNTQPQTSRPQSLPCFEPQSTSGQFIQQSARRNTYPASPRRGSFQTGHKSHRSNSRGNPRRKSIRNSQSGKPRMIGTMKSTPISSVSSQQINLVPINAERVHVIRPVGKPVMVKIPPTKRTIGVQELPASLAIESAERNTTDMKNGTITPPLIDLEPMETQAPSTQDLPASLAILLPGKPTETMNGAITPPLLELETGQPVVQETPILKLPVHLAPPEGAVERSRTPWPTLLSPPSSPKLAPSDQKSQPSHPKSILLSPPPPVPAEAEPRSPRWWEIEMKEKTPEKRRSEMPDILRIGNKENSSLFARLVNLDSLEVSSRY